jgi:hypothetical protein
VDAWLSEAGRRPSVFVRSQLTQGDLVWRLGLPRVPLTRPVLTSHQTNSASPSPTASTTPSQA